MRSIPRPGLAGEMRTIARRLDPNLPLGGPTSLRAQVGRAEASYGSQAPERFALVGLAGWFGLVALAALAYVEISRRATPSSPPAAHRSSS